MEEYLSKFLILLGVVIIIVALIAYFVPILTEHIINKSWGQTATTQGLQPLPQDYYVITQPPKGIVVQQEQSSFNLTDILSGLLGGGAASIYAKIRGDKNQKTVQDVAQTQVKIAEVQQGTLEQVYENMPQKGNEITNKPVIKQENIKEIKDKAVETAAKA